MAWHSRTISNLPLKLTLSHLSPSLSLSVCQSSLRSSLPSHFLSKHPKTSSTSNNFLWKQKMLERENLKGNRDGKSYKGKWKSPLRMSGKHFCTDSPSYFFPLMVYFEEFVINLCKSFTKRHLEALLVNQSLLKQWKQIMVTTKLNQK